jgi:hypothetical protein
MIALLALACRLDNPAPTRAIAWSDPGTEALARRACYDCHSNETEWPWYAHAPGVGLVVSADVHRARCHMNFSEWDRPNEEAWEAAEEVLDGDMPLPTYLLAHPAARLTDPERSELAAGLRATFEADPPLPGEACED